MAKPNLAPILERLNQAGGYHPFSADVFTDWSQEAGDVVTIKKGDDTYASPIHVSKVKWTGQSRVQINADGNESRDAIAKVSRKKYGRGSSGMYNNSRIYHEMSDYYGALTSKIEMTESHLIVEFDQMYNGLHSEIVSTASIFQVNLDNYYEGLSSTITATASVFQVNLDNYYQGLSSTITATASKFGVELNNAYQGLSSSITATASKFSVDLSNAYQGLSSSITATASKIETQITNSYAGLSSRLTQTDSKINAEVKRATDKDTELEGQLIVEAGRAGLVVTVTDNRPIVYYPKVDYFPNPGDPNKIYLSVYDSKYYEWKNGAYSLTTPGQKINAGGIVTEINENDEVETHINSDKVYIGNQKSTTVINGKCTLAEVTADIVKSRIENISLVNVQAIAGSNASAYCHLNEFKGNYYKVNISGGGGSVSTNDLCDGVYDLQIVQSGNTYTLQKRNIKSSTWTDVGSFSRAASTTLTGAWGGNTEPKHLVVTASPQNEKYYEYFTTGAKQNEDGTAYTSGKVWYVPINGYPQGTPPVYTQIMRVKCDASAIYNNGWGEAVKRVSYPTSTGSNAYITIGFPTSIVDAVAGTRQYIMSDDGNNAVKLTTVVNSNQVTVASFPHGQWNAGYDVARRYISWPSNLSPGEIRGSFTVYVPNSGRSGQENIPFVLSSGTPSASGGYAALAKNGTAIARIDISNWWEKGYEAGDAAGQTTGYNSAHVASSWSTASGSSNANKLTVAKASEGNDDSLSFIISAGATIAWNSSTNALVATAKAKVDNVQRGDAATASSGEIAIGSSFDNDGYFSMGIYVNGTVKREYPKKARVWPDVTSATGGTSATFNLGFDQYLKLRFTNQDEYSWLDDVYAWKTPSNPYPQTKTMKCTQATFSQSEWHYFFEYVTSNSNMFTTGKNYKFHNNTGYT